MPYILIFSVNNSEIVYNNFIINIYNVAFLFDFFIILIIILLIEVMRIK